MAKAASTAADANVPAADANVPAADARGIRAGRRGRGRALTRQEIVEAALELAERSGASSLSLRRIGEQLGVDATAFYRHFRDKDELLVAMFDQVLALQVTPSMEIGHDAGWRERLELIGRVCWESQERYPVTFSLSFARVTGGPAERALVEYILAALAATGLPRVEVVAAYFSYVEPMLALCGMRACVDSLEADYRERDLTAWSRIYARLPEANYPAARAHSVELAHVDDKAIYDRVLCAVLDSIERTVAAHSSV